MRCSGVVRSAVERSRIRRVLRCGRMSEAAVRAEGARAFVQLQIRDWRGEDSSGWLLLWRAECVSELPSVVAAAFAARIA